LRRMTWRARLARTYPVGFRKVTAAAALTAALNETEPPGLTAEAVAVEESPTFIRFSAQRKHLLRDTLSASSGVQ